MPNALALFGWRQRLILVVLALAAYAPTLHVGFMLDDPWLIQQNAYIREWSAANLKHDFTSNVQNEPQGLYYRPALTLLLRAEYSLWAGQPLGYHLVNLLFQVQSGVLLAGLALLLGLSGLNAMLLSSLFVVHPIIVDDLMAASGGDMMANCFLLASVVFICRQSIASYWMGLAFYVLALFSKESAIVVPFLCALVFWYLRRPRRDYWRLLALLLLWVPYFALRSTAVSFPSGITLALLGKFIFQALPRILLHYIGLILIPWNLQTWPPILRLSHLWPLHLAAWIGLISALWFRKNRLGLFCLAWFLINLAPRIPALMNNQVMMDKWVYISAIGVLLPLSLGLTRLWTHPQRWVQYAGRSAGLSVIVLCSLLVHFNVALRGSDEKNYRWTLRFGRPDFAVYRLGIILLKTGRAGEALPYFEQLHQDHPRDPNYINTLALALWHTGKKREAIRSLQALVKERPNDPVATDNLKWMLSK